jgi:hypothetical protein
VLTEWVTRIGWKCRPTREMSPNQTPVSCADVVKIRIANKVRATISGLNMHRIVNVSTIVEKSVRQPSRSD